MVRLEQIILKLQNRVNEHKALAERWEKVSRLSKKNGDDFSVLSKNFDGCSVYDKQYGHRKNDKELHVSTSYTYTENGRSYSKYAKECIDVVGLVKYSKNPISDDRIIKETCLEPYYIKTVDELFQEIKERIEYHNQRVVELENQLKMASENYGQIANKMNEIHDILKGVCEFKPNSPNLDLRYALEEVVKTWYFN